MYNYTFLAHNYTFCIKKWYGENEPVEKYVEKLWKTCGKVVDNLWKTFSRDEGGVNCEQGVNRL